MSFLLSATGAIVAAPTVVAAGALGYLAKDLRRSSTSSDSASATTEEPASMQQSSTLDDSTLNAQSATSISDELRQRNRSASMSSVSSTQDPRPWWLRQTQQHNEKKWQRDWGVNYGHNSHDKWL